MKCQKSKLPTRKKKQQPTINIEHTTVSIKLKSQKNKQYIVNNQ